MFSLHFPTDLPTRFLLRHRNRYRSHLLGAAVFGSDMLATPAWTTAAPPTGSGASA